MVDIILKNSFVLVSYYLFDLVALVLFNIITARFLGVEEFGRFTFILSFVLLFSLLSEAGTSLGITKLVARGTQEGLSHVYSGLGLRIILAALAVIVTLISFKVLSCKEDFLPCLLIAISGGIKSLSEYICYAFRGLRVMTREPLIMGSEKLFLLVGGFLLLSYGYGVIELALLYLVGRTISFLLALILWARDFGFLKVTLDWGLAKGLLKESFPIAINRLSESTTLYLLPIFLTLLWGKECNGLFQSAYKVALVPTILITVIVQSLYPSMVSHYTTKGDLSIFYHTCLKILFNLSMPCALIFFVFSEDIIVTMFGTEYIRASGILRLFSPYVILWAMVSLSWHTLCAVDRQDSLIKPSFLLILINLFIGYPLIYLLGSIGAASMFLLGSTLLVIIYTLRMRALNILWEKDFYVQVVSAIIVTFIALGLRDSAPSGLLYSSQICLFAISLYFFALFTFGGISLKEKEIINHIWKNLTYHKKPI